LYLAHSDPYTSDHRRNDLLDRGLYQLSNPCTTDHRHLESDDREVCQVQPHMDDTAWLCEQRNRFQHSDECPHGRCSTDHDHLRSRDFEPIDSLVRGCPGCWRDYGRDHIPTLYSRPSYDHLELPSLIRQARDLETAQRIVRSNLNACLRNRELRPRDMAGLLHPIRNRYGDYPYGFDEPRPISWLRALDRELTSPLLWRAILTMMALSRRTTRAHAPRL
jgi:hypothetical protein